MLWTSLLILLITYQEDVQSSDVVVATFNIWNVMFHWPVRKLFIADMIKKSGADIVCFQEVRFFKYNLNNQIDDLQQLLPEYSYKYYQPTHKVTEKSDILSTTLFEGIGFLSKHRVLNVHSYNLSSSTPRGKDNLKRMFTHAQFYIDDSYEFDIILVHLSYDRQSQCANVGNLLQYIYSIGVEHVVIVGDFNTYNDYEWPIQALLEGKFQVSAPYSCRRYGTEFDKIQYKGYGYGFIDAWKEKHPDSKGYTFSNMPIPGFINRPDRILVSKVGLVLKNVVINGKGHEYALEHLNDLWYERWSTLLYAMISGEKKCAWDCGPHGSCRCGICVNGRNQNSCSQNPCSECSRNKLIAMAILSLSSFISIMYIMLYNMFLLVDLSRQKCLSVYRLSMRYRYLHNHRFCLLSICCLLINVFFMKLLLSGASQVVDNQLAEELNPSDHLMVVARIHLL